MIDPVDLADLLEVSRFAGSDVLTVQGGGGNTSVKGVRGDVMWIKASGLRLRELRADHGYVHVDVAAALTDVRGTAPAAVARTEAHGALRASLETGFHAALGRVVVHTHPVYANAFTCMRDGDLALTEAAPSLERAPWVPYRTPGRPLSVAVDEAARAHAREWGAPPSTVMLGNHGVITSALTAAGAIEATHALLAAGRAYFGDLPDDALATGVPSGAAGRWVSALAARLGAAATRAVRPGRYAVLEAAARRADPALFEGPLMPDDVVHLGAGVLHAQGADDPARWLDRAGASPPDCLIVAVEDVGMVYCAPSPSMIDAMEEALLAHWLVRQLIARRGVARALDPSEVARLESMESERYRRLVAARGPT